MKENAAIVAAQLQKGLPGRVVTYDYISSLEVYRFRIKESKTTHWLYISKEFMEDHERVWIINMLWSVYHLSDIYKDAKTTKRLLLTNDGIKEVDENYCKE